MSACYNLKILIQEVSIITITHVLFLFKAHAQTLQSDTYQRNPGPQELRQQKLQVSPRQ